MLKIKGLLFSSAEKSKDLPINNTLKIATIIFGIFSLLAFVRFVLGGSEDEWICQDGQWVKHGAPATPAPEGGC